MHVLGTSVDKNDGSGWNCNDILQAFIIYRNAWDCPCCPDPRKVFCDLSKSLPWVLALGIFSQNWTDSWVDPSDCFNVITYLALASTLKWRCTYMWHRNWHLWKDRILSTRLKDSAVHRIEKEDKGTNAQKWHICFRNGADSIFSGTSGRGTFSFRRSREVTRSTMLSLLTGPTVRSSS